MTKVISKLVEHDNRYYFNDGTGYFLIDTGFGQQSISPDGKIGPFTTNSLIVGGCQNVTNFLDSFMGQARPEGQKAKGILAPMEGYSVLFKGETVTIDNAAQELPVHDYFIPFVSAVGPIIEGKCNGKPMRFFFDSGMRMAVLDDNILIDGKSSLGIIQEWIAIERCLADVPYYSAQYEFADGFCFNGHGEYDYSNIFLRKQREFCHHAFDAFFGIELFKQYDLFISLIPGKRGIAIIRRD